MCVRPANKLAAAAPCGQPEQATRIPAVLSREKAHLSPPDGIG